MGFDERNLSRREREIMDIVYELGEAAVADVAGRMSAGTSYDSVRITLGILKNKGCVASRREGRRYVYTPTVPHGTASRFALRRFMRTFFKGSPSKAILTMLDESSGRLSRDDIDRIASWLEKEKDHDRRNS